MVSKEAQKSIERFKRFSNLVSSLYRSPNEITKWRIFLFRWLINLQGTLSPKIKNTNKEVIYLDGIRTLKVSTSNSNSDSNRGAPSPPQPPAAAARPPR